MLKLKRVYRFALINLLGIVGSIGTMLSVMSLYFTANNDFLVPMVFFGLITWFYIEVVVPNNKNN
tara:strand:- start:1854 stop:2048 length:195 start_codon:yes stop_codon:yes gene_type:complete